MQSVFSMKIANKISWPDNIKTYSFYHDNLRRPAHAFGYVIELEYDGVSHPIADWCTENCNSPWGWWFGGLGAFLGFADPEDAFAFMLHCSDQ